MICKKSKVYLLPLLFAAALSMTACGSSKEKKESAPADSIRMTDSMAIAQEMIAAQEEMEQAREDSIQRIIERIPTFKEIRAALKTYTPETQLKLFRNRGFTANSKKYTYTISEEEAGAVGPGTYTDYTPVVATLTIDGKEVCKYQEIREHGSGFKLTVNGAPQVLEQMKKEGQACLKKDINDIGYYGDDWRQYCRCRVKGNTFEYFIDQIGD